MYALINSFNKTTSLANNVLPNLQDARDAAADGSWHPSTIDPVWYYLTSKCFFNFPHTKGKCPWYIFIHGTDTLWELWEKHKYICNINHSSWYDAVLDRKLTPFSLPVNKVSVFHSLRNANLSQYRFHKYYCIEYGLCPIWMMDETPYAHFLLL